MPIPFADVKGLLFDKDGTLFDFQDSWSQWAFSFVRSFAPDQDTQSKLAHALGFDMDTRTFRSDSAVIAGTPEETVNAVASVAPDTDPDTVRQWIITSSSGNFQTPVTDLRRLFETFTDHGFHLGIATNDAEAAAHAHMAQFNLTDLFPFVAGYDSGHGEKPGPGQMNAFRARFALSPQQVIMIGDSTHDLAAGKAAGMYTLGVLTGVADAETLQPLADMILPSIADMPELFAIST